MTRRDIRSLILYESGADKHPNPLKRERRRAYWRLWAAWCGWPA